MAFFAIVLLDKWGKILVDQPEGCGFDEAYMQGVASEEIKYETPHPAVHDMGGGYHFHALWSGRKPFIISPEFIVGLVADESEDAMEIKKHLRKITNNVLLSYKSNPTEIRQYLADVWETIASGEINAIQMIRPTVEANEIAQTTPIPTSTVSQASPASPTSPSPQSEYEDLMDLGNTTPSRVQPVNQGNPFDSQASTDPFGGTAGSSDPFGNASNDPFGSSGTPTDPFGSSGGSGSSLKPKTISPTATNSNIKYNPNLFSTSTTSKPSSSNGENEFEDNPWANEPEPTTTKSSDFSDNPWATEETEEKKKKDVDPFDDNPFA